MSFPKFRFTLNNSIAGSLVISEPVGWDEAVLKLERNLEFHSLVEFYDQPLTFYGQSSEGNGGLDYIREIEKGQGPDAQITILIEISHDEGDTYTVAFDGLIDITSCKEIDFYKAEYGIIRNDFWQKFMNRKGTPVNLAATTDLDGNAISVTAPDTITLTSQVLRQSYTGYNEIQELINPASWSATDYFQIGMQIENISEIQTKFTIPTGINTSLPANIWAMDNDGQYAFDIRIEMSLQDLRFPTIYPQYMGTYLTWYIQVNTDAAIALTKTNHTDAGLSFFKDSTSYAYSNTLTLSKGDEVRIYGDFIAPSPDPTTMIVVWDKGSSNPSGTATPTYINVTANTTLASTTVDGYQILDAVNLVTSKLVGSTTPVSSDYLSADYGCGGNYLLTRGLNIRGYSLTDKPFFLSFDQWWAGANPILNLGLGYINGTDVIEIEQKSEFYNPTPVLNLDYVNAIERSYKQDFIFKSVEIGYEKWSAESDSGVDDPQTKRVFRTRFKTVGNDIKILSKFYAASLGIEQTRRNRVELGKDWRLDEDIFIIALKKSNLTQPETGADFSTITGLLNSDTRYNIRISCARNLMRWFDFLSGCLKWYSIDDDYTFSSGEGNFDMTSKLLPPDCEGDGLTIDEKGNFDSGAGHDILFVPIQYEFEHPLTWDQYKAIRDYRKKAIGVSRTDSGHVPCFIMSLEYHVTRGLGKFTVLLGQETPL